MKYLKKKKHVSARIVILHVIYLIHVSGKRKSLGKENVYYSLYRNGKAAILSTLLKLNQFISLARLSVEIRAKIKALIRTFKVNNKREGIN